MFKRLPSHLPPVGVVQSAQEPGDGPVRQGEQALLTHRAARRRAPKRGPATGSKPNDANQNVWSTALVNSVSYPVGLVGRPGLDPGTLGLQSDSARPADPPDSIRPAQIRCRVQPVRLITGQSINLSSKSVAR